MNVIAYHINRMRILGFGWVIRGFVRWGRGGRLLLRGLGLLGCFREIFRLLGGLVWGFLACGEAVLAWCRSVAGRLGLFRS